MEWLGRFVIIDINKTFASINLSQLVRDQNWAIQKKKKK